MNGNKKTIVTTNAPIEVPGKVLPPGTYVFKLLDSTANRNIVQIFDKDEKQLYATILAIPNYRQEPSDKPLIQLDERPSNSPGSDQGLVLSRRPIRARVRVPAPARRGTGQAIQTERALDAGRHDQEHEDPGDVRQRSGGSVVAEDRGDGR